MRKTLKKFIALAAALLLLLAILPLSALASDAEAEAAANELYALGLFEGVAEDAQGAPVFRLERAPTRGEAVTMLVRLLGRESEALSLPYDAPFADVADWAKPYVNYAWRQGLTDGVSETRFGTDSPAGAAHYLTFLLRALGYEDGADFVWSRAWELSDSLGVSAGQYAEESAFTRGDVAILSRNALYIRLKGSELRLIDVLPIGSGFEIHFVDVGEADAALVLCDGHAMLIDGGNADDSSLLYTYLKDKGVERLDYVVCTHPHEDHVGGLSGALNYARADAALCPVTAYDSRAFSNFVRQLERQGVSITVPAPGDSFPLGSARFQILGPIDPDKTGNNASIVLRIEYGETSFLMTGDAEREEELDLLASGYALKSTLLKVGHHGSADASSYPFLYAVEARYAVISVGEGNPYGHPSEATLSRLRDADAQIYRTDLNGTVVCASDGKTLSFTTEREGGPTPGNTQPESAYVLNVRSLVFHRPDCESVRKMSDGNKLPFDGTRDEAVALGYRPCGVCKP